jgi:hypothetical protein
LGKRICNPSSDHHLNDYDNDHHFDGCAHNNDHGCADDHHDEHDLNYINHEYHNDYNDYHHHGPPWLT